MTSFCPYELVFKGGGTRSGFLIRVEEVGKIGYADCHPWEELGDDPVSIQIEKLQQGAVTPLLEQAKEHAALDALARSQQRHLFADRHMPKSHLLTTFSDLKNWPKYKQWGITHLKIKLKHDQIEDWLKVASDHSVLWRLDFNAGLTEKQAERFLERASGFPIDLIEDICPYNFALWSSWQKRFNIPLAVDFEKAPEWPIKVHKPCTRALTERAERLIVTSSLGHPVGQLMAAYMATTLSEARNEVGGWLSHLVYEPTPFSQQLHIVEGRLVPPPGTGVGFDDLLQELPWNRI